MKVPVIITLTISSCICYKSGSGTQVNDLGSKVDVFSWQQGLNTTKTVASQDASPRLVIRIIRRQESYFLVDQSQEPREPPYFTLQHLFQNEHSFYFNINFYELTPFNEPRVSW